MTGPAQFAMAKAPIVTPPAPISGALLQHLVSAVAFRPIVNEAPKLQTAQSPRPAKFGYQTPEDQPETECLLQTLLAQIAEITRATN